jgi:hypothetical protein
MELHLRGTAATAEMRQSSNPNKDEGFAISDSRRPHLEHTAEINPCQTPMNKGDFQQAISAAESERSSGQGSFFDLEV